MSKLKKEELKEDDLKKDKLKVDELKKDKLKEEELKKEKLIKDASNESEKNDNEDLIDEEKLTEKTSEILKEDNEEIIDEAKLNEIHTELIESKGRNYKQLEEKFHKIFINIILAILVVLYFAILLFENTKISNIQFINYLKISSIVCLCLSLILFENSYYKDYEDLFMNAIEISGLGICTLYLLNITIKQNINLNLCVIVMISAFVLYYFLKAIYIRLKRKNYEYDMQDNE